MYFRLIIFQFFLTSILQKCIYILTINCLYNLFNLTYIYILIFDLFSFSFLCMIINTHFFLDFFLCSFKYFFNSVLHCQKKERTKWRLLFNKVTTKETSAKDALQCIKVPLKHRKKTRKKKREKDNRKRNLFVLMSTTILSIMLMLTTFNQQ